MKKYKALRTIASILKVVGIIYGVLTILGALGACIALGAGASYMYDEGLGIIMGILYGLLILIIGGIAALMMYAGGELIYLLIDVEENTRETADLLRAASGANPTF